MPLSLSDAEFHEGPVWRQPPDLSGLHTLEDVRHLLLELVARDAVSDEVKERVRAGSVRSDRRTGGGPHDGGTGRRLCSSRWR